MPETPLDRALKVYEEYRALLEKLRKEKKEESELVEKKNKEESDRSDDSIYEEHVHDSGPPSDADDEEKARHREEVRRRQEHRDRDRARAFRHNRTLAEAGVTDPSRFIPTSVEMLPPHKRAATREEMAKAIVQTPEDVSVGLNVVWMQCSSRLVS